MAVARQVVSPFVLAALIGCAILNTPHRGDTAPRPMARHAKPEGPPALPCGDPFAFQVRLDRQSFSPGEIDGTFGSNASRALAAFQATHGLEPTGAADCDTWSALGGDTSGATTVTYVINERDVKGPFTKAIPRDLERQAALPALAYRSPVERLGERFHVSPALLQQLNPQAKFTSGAEIAVPAVMPFDVDAEPPKEPVTPDVTIQVTRDDSALRVFAPNGTVVFFAPVTTGSEHDPLPIGDWKVTAVNWRPVFNYNPKLFWDANPTHSKARIKAGPNNPVGIIWIDLNLQHYGLHGTPEPSRIGHTESHGCVRLTNWDAARVAAFVRPDTPVQFR